MLKTELIRHKVASLTINNARAYIRAIKSRRLGWAGHVARMEEGRSDLKMLTGTSAGKGALERPRRR